MKASLSLITLFACATAGTALVADNENYDGLDFSGRDFSGKSLKNSSWVEANLTSAYLYDTTLTDADFTDAVIVGANFDSSDLTLSQLYSTASYKAKNLSGVILDELDLSNGNFSGVNLTSAGLWHAILADANFTNANLSSADLSYATLTNVGFTNANLAGAWLHDATSANADFTDASLVNTYLADADFTDADFTRANLTSASLLSATLTGADFTDAVIIGAHFDYSNLTLSQLRSTASYKEKNLSGVGLSKLDLSNENFSDFNLSSAYLSSATLMNVDFTRADLSSAYLGYTTLTNADFTDAVIIGADFYSSDLTLSQLRSTASYKEKNLSGVGLGGFDLSYKSFFEFNLSSANLYAATLTNADFKRATLTDANFLAAKIVGADFGFSDLSLSQLCSTASYEEKNLSGVGLIGLDLSGGDFSCINLSSANLYNATLTNADFTDAVIVGANFDSSGLTLSQLYSTASYKEKNLSDVAFDFLDLSGGDFSGINLTSAGLNDGTLTDADFTNADLTGAEFESSTLSRADFRGATGLSLIWDVAKQAFCDTITGTNVILADGTIGAFDVASGTTFRIRSHELSAKLRDQRMVSGTLVLEAGATLDICADATLHFDHGEAHFMASESDNGLISVKSAGSVTFSETAKLVIDFTGTFTEDTRFSVLTWENGASVTGLDLLTKGDTLSLLVDGVAYDNSLWNFSTGGNALTIFGASGDSGGTDEPIIPDNPVIPEDPKNIAITTALQSVVLSDTDYKASLASSLKTFSGSVSGSGELHSSYDVTFSGDARAHTGTTYVDAGTFTIDENAKLGTGAFEVSGTMKLSGTREFSNATRGDGELNVAAGTTSFSNDIGVQTLSVSQGATAVLNSDVDLTHANAKAKIAGTLKLLGNRDVNMTGISGAGTLATTGTVSLSGNASAFSGTFEIGGELKLSDSRNFANATRGDGKISLTSGADVSFAKAVGVKTLSVEQGATLRGNVSLTHDSAELSLAGELVLNADNGEKVSLGGGKAVLADTAMLNLVGNVMTYSRASSGQIAALESGRKVSIFENGEVAGDVLAFLSTDSDLAIYAQDYAVIYDASNGLSVQVVKNAGALVGNAGTSGFSASFVDWALGDANDALASLTSGFISTADFSNLPGGNDSLLQAVISGDSGVARAILDRLSPKSYAAMVAMPTEAFNSDARSIASRLEQRRSDRFSKYSRWEFFALAQTNSAENDSSASAPTFDFDTYGVLAGADYTLDKNTAVGIALGTGTGEAKIHNGGGKIESMDFRFTGYAGKRFENYFVNAGAQLGYASYDVKRKTDYGNANGDTTGWSVGVFADAGTVLTISEEKKVYATPYVGFAYMHAQAGGFSESGSDKAFDADDISGDSLRVRVGCGFSWGFDLAEKAWRVGLDVAYSHDFLGDEVDVDVTTADGHKISETAKALPESMFSVGPTLNVDLNASTSLYGGYTFSSGMDSYVNHSANVGFRVLF